MWLIEIRWKLEKRIRKSAKLRQTTLICWIKNSELRRPPSHGQRSVLVAAMANVSLTSAATHNCWTFNPIHTFPISRAAFPNSSAFRFSQPRRATIIMSTSSKSTVLVTGAGGRTGITSTFSHRFNVGLLCAWFRICLFALSMVYIM